jgi:transcriptional regulator with XRE-family HTH domain
MNELLEELQENGCKISSVQSLRQWLDGSVLCPEDPEDLWRLADALNMDFIMQNYKRINKASHRLRGIHSGLAIKLNNWLIKQAKGIIEEDENMYELIDDELGLTLQDFKDALTILQVKSIDEKQGLFYRDSLGRLEKEA